MEAIRQRRQQDSSTGFDSSLLSVTQLSTVQCVVLRDSVCINSALRDLSVLCLMSLATTLLLLHPLFSYCNEKLDSIKHYHKEGLFST